MIDEKVESPLREDRLKSRQKYLLTLAVLLISLIIVFFAWAQAQVPNPGHAASQIGAGIFSAGNYAIQGNLNVSENITLKNLNASGILRAQNLTGTNSLCIGTDCKTAWSQAGGATLSTIRVFNESGTWSTVAGLSYVVVEVWGGGGGGGGGSGTTGEPSLAYCTVGCGNKGDINICGQPSAVLAGSSAGVSGGAGAQGGGAGGGGWATGVAGTAAGQSGQALGGGGGGGGGGSGAGTCTNGSIGQTSSFGTFLNATGGGGGARGYAGGYGATGGCGGGYAKKKINATSLGSTESVTVGEGGNGGTGGGTTGGAGGKGGWGLVVVHEYTTS